MKIVSEISLESFEAWSGGKDTLDRVISEGKCDELEAMLEDLYPDGMTDTQLNDLLWFEPETVYNWLGIRTESEIRSELEEAREELDSLKEEFEDAVSEEADEINANREIAGMNELDNEEMEELRSKLWKDYADDAEELEEKISELEEELENI